MRAAISLLVLLFSIYGAQTQSTHTEVQTESQSTGVAAATEVTIQLDVSAELKELRDMVVELRALLTDTQNQNDAQDTELVLMKERLAVSETKVEFLERMNAAQDTEIAALKTRLSACETVVENLKMENAAQEAELTEVKTRLSACESDVVNLEKEITEQPKVAFSAALTNSGYIGSGSTDMNLVFTKTITNVGQAYSSITGFFTAPVRGVYYFRFTVLDILASRSINVRMVKNGEQVMQIFEYDTDGQHTYLSSGVTLQLEVGDVVNMQLPANRRLYDSINNHCIFSGFLLFPL